MTDSSQEAFTKIKQQQHPKQHLPNSDEDNIQLDTADYLQVPVNSNQLFFFVAFFF